jgi:glycopeptide antibiotics resistance protein
MVEFLRFFIEQIHRVHTAVLNLNDIYGWALSDKDLHFILFGGAAVVMFILTHALFKRLAKLSLSTLSFIYVSTVMFALAMAIEFGQRLTNQGVMDFEDVVYGMYGVFVFMSIYLMVAWLVRVLKRLMGLDK